MKLIFAAAAALLIAFGAPAYGVVNPEVEPNNVKATATLCNSGGVGMDAGDTITGATTGTSTSIAGISSADYLLVQTKARPLGIYRYRLAFTSATAGHTISIRGLTQSAGNVNAGTDAGVQTQSTGIVPGSRTVQWYGFGRQERIYVKLTGQTSTTAGYTGVLSVDIVTPVDVPGIVDGTVTIKEGAGTSTGVDTDFIVYNSSLAPVPNYRWDNPDATGLTAEFTAGTYFVVFGTFNTMDDKPSAPGDANLTASVLDFPNALVNTSTSNVANHVLSIVTDAGESITDFARPGAFDLNFARVAMAINTISLPPNCVATISPTDIFNEGAGVYDLSVTINPGRRPASVNHVVSVDLSLLGDTRPQPVILNQTSATTFSISGVVADNTTPGPYQLTVTVQETAPLSRSSTCLVNLTVVSPPTGACCTEDGCLIATERNCINQGGIYQGNGALCGGCTCASTNPPENDLCSGAILIPPGGFAVGNTCAASTQNVPTCQGQTSGSGGLWYKFIGTGTNVAIDTCASPTNTRFNTRISVFCGVCDDFTCVAGNDNGCGQQSSVAVCTQLGAEYYVLVHGNAANGDFVVSLSDSGAACDPVVFCIPTGGCCLATECQDVTAERCIALGGTFLGLGAPCVTRTQNPRFVSVDVPVAITDNTISVVSITVPAGSGTIEGSLVMSMNVNHTFVGDLVGTISNGSVSAVLFTREGGGANLIGEYVFTDSASTRLGGSGGGAEVPTGAYLPVQPLSVFDGQPYEGTWTLTIADQAGADIGSINAFVLVEVAVTPNCTQSCALCAADYNVDGGIDGQDIEAFFLDWAAAAPCADVNADGGVDGPDIESFFTVWQAGGC